MNVPKALTPITWKYGAMAAGIGACQGLRMVWYSDSMFGRTWASNNPVAAATNTEKKNTENMVYSTLMEVGCAVLLNYITARYFRPLTPLDALLLTGMLGAVKMIPQLQHALWKTPRSMTTLMIDSGYDATCTLIKILCLMYIPY